MSSNSLVLVHTIFRHGERTADRDYMYPNNPYNKEDFLPYGPGQLTNAGKQEMYDLGKLFRRRYDQYLGDLYLPKYVDARASHFDRAKASLQLVLASLFPPNKETTWNEDLKWLPIPYYSYTFKDDEILGTAFAGGEFFTAYEEYFENEGKRILEGHEELLTHLRKHAGGDFKTTRNVWLLYANLKTELTHGLRLPDWTTPIYPEELSQLAFREYIAQTGTKQLKRLIVGNLMRKILTDTKAKINGSSSHKIHLYSGHDHNIATSLNFFNLLPVYHFPNYAACIILEVHNIDNKYVIKLLYRQSKDAKIEYMTFPNGTVNLNLEDFAKMVEDLFNEDTTKTKMGNN
ncbi:hypothetical protein Trydic_g1570 [Trypoxylus dichotomus]